MDKNFSIKRGKTVLHIDVPPKLKEDVEKAIESGDLLYKNISELVREKLRLALSEVVEKKKEQRRNEENANKSVI